MRRTPLILALALAACSQPAPPAEAPPSAVAAEAARVIVTSPLTGARVSSPLIVEGTAPGDWYFEAQFPVQLRTSEGAILAEAPARAQSDWMTEAPVPFRAELSFSTSQDASATLILQEDMPGEGATPREMTIPVTVSPRP